MHRQLQRAYRALLYAFAALILLRNPAQSAGQTTIVLSTTSVVPTQVVADPSDGVEAVVRGQADRFR